MVLSNKNIKKLVDSGKLVTNFQKEGLQYCSYKFHVGKIIVPSDGTVLESSDLHKKLNCWQKKLQYFSDFFSQQPKYGNNDAGFVIKNNRYILRPREIVLFQTVEEVKMPKDIMAIYTSLNSIASRGIFLINSSTIEPNYEGPLSGILLNISNKDFEMSEHMSIAKATFHRIEGEIANLPATSDKVEATVYTDKLRKRAKNNYGRTFLSIKELGSEIEDGLNKKIVRSISISSTIIGLLLIFSTLQPVFYNLIWGVPSYQVSDRKAHAEYLQLKESEQEKIEILNSRIDSLESLLKSTVKEQNEQQNTQPQRGI
jgi:deoxycytidine triphosphate deaminase